MNFATQTIRTIRSARSKSCRTPNASVRSGALLCELTTTIQPTISCKTDFQLQKQIRKSRIRHDLTNREIGTARNHPSGKSQRNASETAQATLISHADYRPRQPLPNSPQRTRRDKIRCFTARARPQIRSRFSKAERRSTRF